MSVLTDLIYGGSHAVAGLTEGAVNDAIAKFGAEKAIAFPDTAYFFPTIYAATGVKVAKLGDLPACVGVLKSLITDQEDLGQALNAGLATAVGAEIIEGLGLSGGGAAPFSPASSSTASVKLLPKNSMTKSTGAPPLLWLWRYHLFPRTVRLSCRFQRYSFPARVSCSPCDCRKETRSAWFARSICSWV